MFTLLTISLTAITLIRLSENWHNYTVESRNCKTIEMIIDTRDDMSTKIMCENTVSNWIIENVLSIYKLNGILNPLNSFSLYTVMLCVGLSTVHIILLNYDL